VTGSLQAHINIDTHVEGFTRVVFTGTLQKGQINGINDSDGPRKTIDDGYNGYVLFVRHCKK